MAFLRGFVPFFEKKGTEKSFSHSWRVLASQFFLHRAGFAPSARDVTGCNGWFSGNPLSQRLWQGREVYCLQVSFFMPLTCKHRTCPLCQGLALRESCRRRRLRGFAAGASRLKENPKTSRPCQTRAQHSQSEEGKNRKSVCAAGHTARFLPDDFLFGVTRGEQPLVRCGERGVQRVRGGSRNTPLTLWPSGASRL